MVGVVGATACGLGRWAYNDKYWDAAMALERPLEASGRMGSAANSVGGSESTLGLPPGLDLLWDLGISYWIRC